MPEARHRRSRASRRASHEATNIPRAATQRRGTNKLYLVASIIIAVLVIAGFAVPSILQTVGQPSGGDLGDFDEYVEGIGTQHEIMPTKNHVDTDGDPTNDFVAYNSVPPTSGDHWSRPQGCGFYTAPVADEIIVHNLEHSNIVISYNLGDSAQVEALREVYDGLGVIAQRYGIARPYDALAPGQVALAAWGVSDVMDGVDADRIDTFFSAYVGRLGPEGNISCGGSQQSMEGT